VELTLVQPHAPLTITISLPSGSATRQRSCDSSTSRLPAARVVARRVRADHEPETQIDQQPEARVVAERRCCGGQVSLLLRRGGAVARDRAEDRLPVGCPDPLVKRRPRQQVDLVAVRVGVTNPDRYGPRWLIGYEPGA
jgi:hypothetical protein